MVTQKDQLFEHTENDVKEHIAQELKMPWSEIEQTLYADVMEYQRLTEFEGYTDASALLSRYNVAQIQAALYRAETMNIRAGDDFKTILRYAKTGQIAS